MKKMFSGNVHTFIGVFSLYHNAIWLAGHHWWPIMANLLLASSISPSTFSRANKRLFLPWPMDCCLPLSTCFSQSCECLPHRLCLETPTANLDWNYSALPSLAPMWLNQVPILVGFTLWDLSTSILPWDCSTSSVTMIFLASTDHIISLGLRCLGNLGKCCFLIRATLISHECYSWKRPFLDGAKSSLTSCQYVHHSYSLPT